MPFYPLKCVIFLLATTFLSFHCAQALQPLCDNEPFELFTVGAAESRLNGKQLQACDQAFFVGGEACTFCPLDSSTASACESALNTTVFLLPSAMDVVVPGGQLYYIRSDGALAFQQAHSAILPPGAIEGNFSAYPDGGEFTWAGAIGWMACPGPTVGLYQIFANDPSKDSSAGCVPLHLVTKTVLPGTFGAWQYD